MLSGSRHNLEPRSSREFVLTASAENSQAETEKAGWLAGTTRGVVPYFRKTFAARRKPIYRFCDETEEAIHNEVRTCGANGSTI